MNQGLLDTSVFIAAESGRGLDVASLPDESFVSVVTLAELRAGVLATVDPHTRALRLATLESVAAIESLAIDQAAAAAWAEMRVALAHAARRVNINSLWIASVAVAHSMPVVTQDDDFDVLAELGFLAVAKV